MKGIAAGRYLLFFAIVVVGCVVDLATKQWVFSELGLPGPDAPKIWIWQDCFALETSLNRGALFGFGGGMVILFSIVSLCAVLGILYWLFLAGAAVDRFLTIALGMITAGILGNLYDRLGLHHLTWPTWHEWAGQPVYAVRDWILWQINDDWRWPNFNIADSLLVCGAALLLWHAFGMPRRQEEVRAD